MSADKDAARKAAFARRKGAFGAGLDGAAQHALRDVLQPYAGQALSGFMPIRTEIDPLPVMTDWGGPVCVPVIVGKGQPLVFHRWAPGMEMIVGPFGARVPATAEPVVPQVLIVPLLAFDANGYRLGYGGGFYDRTLQELRARGETLAIGFAFEAQFADSIPLESTDQRLDLIVTEAGVRRFG